MTVWAVLLPACCHISSLLPYSRLTMAKLHIQWNLKIRPPRYSDHVKKWSKNMPFVSVIDSIRNATTSIFDFTNASAICEQVQDSELRPAIQFWIPADGWSVWSLPALKERLVSSSVASGCMLASGRIIYLYEAVALGDSVSLSLRRAIDWFESIGSKPTPYPCQHNAARNNSRL